MRMSLALALMLGFAVVGTARQDEGKNPLAPGKNLPESFHPFNVTEVVPVSAEPDTDKPKPKISGYSPRGKFHSLINEYDLDPVVMLFARGLDDNKAFLDLLKKVDAAIDRNRKGVQLRAFVVFLYDDLTDVTDQDEKREELTRKLADLEKDIKLPNVVLTLSCPKDLARYALDDSALTAVLYRKLKIAATHRVPADKLDAVDGPAVKAILSDVTGKLGAR